ncbi:MAG: Carbonic anhydrase, beta class [Rhodanobacteraceae bacterium]|jgi:carbonic anhydrase|nr:MAG: Carbonic anhydrase, beta class [Rhodanobacteraceae bacterium]
MPSPQELLENNRRWSAAIRAQDPHFFERLSKQQTPKYLWIGCSDSRVPANQILGIDPGEVFVHRNISNLVLHSDMNCLSVMQFAVDVLKVEHIMITGHYGCGGVGAALKGDRLGLIDNWLRYIGDTLERHRALVDAVPPAQRHDRLCELNVIEQVANACHTTIVRDAWDRGQPLTVHGWCYGLSDGRIHELGITVPRFEALEAGYSQALARLTPSPA